MPLIEQPVLIPTSQGPAGGIVCEPEGSPRAALILLQGGGRAGRSGFSSQWAVLSRRLAALGATVLRYDYWKEGDSSMITAERYPIGTHLSANVARDLALLRDVASWFLARTGGLEPIVVGYCYGARLGLELAAGLPSAASTVLVVPYLRRIEETDRANWTERMRRVHAGRQPEDQADRAQRSAVDLLDPVAVEAFERVVHRGPSWVLIGERDAGEAVALAEVLGDRGLEVEIEPDVALYPGNEPDVQELVRRRIEARVSRLLA